MSRPSRRRPALAAVAAGAVLAAAGLFLVVGRAWAPEPTTQATLARVAAPFPEMIAVSSPLVVAWTKGSGAESLVVMKEGAPVDADPTDGVTYSADTTFGTSGNGSEIGTGNFVVYAGTGAEVTVTVPQSDLPYHIAVYSYDPGDHNYLQTNPARTNSGHNAAHGIRECARCHFAPGDTAPHGSFEVPRGAGQADKCKTCHMQGQIAAAKSAVNLHQGTKYLTGGTVVDCGSCHDAHNGADFMTTDTHTGGQTATNVNWVRKNVSKYAADWTAGTPVEALYQATTGFFAFDETNSPWNGICQACHTGTDFHRNNSQVTHNHPSTPLPLCTNCHTHAGPEGTDYGFRPSGGACPDCHNSTQGTNRRQIVQSGSGSGEFGGSGGGQAAWTSHHVNSGSIEQVVTKWDCVVCHAEGDVDTGETTSYHNNVPSGQTACDAPNPCPVDLKNVDTGVVLDVVAPDSSTDWRNLSAALRSEFCMSCHDADGALLVGSRPASPPANDPDAADYTTVALSPFNDNVTNHHEGAGCEGGNTCGGGSVPPHPRRVSSVTAQPCNDTSIPPPGPLAPGGETCNPARVVDVKGQFETTNMSHHAVRGSAYGADPFGQTGILHTAIQGVRTDLGWTSTLNCEDCHADGGGGLDPGNMLNGHGTKNARYMLRNSAGNDVLATDTDLICFRCHNPIPWDVANGNSAYQEHDQSPHEGSSDRNFFGIWCLNCHGGRAWGGVHGGNFQVLDDHDNGPQLYCELNPAVSCTRDRDCSTQGLGGCVSGYLYNPNAFTYGGALDYISTWTSGASGVTCSARSTAWLMSSCTQHSSQTYDRGTGSRTYRAPTGPFHP